MLTNVFRVRSVEKDGSSKQREPLYYRKTGLSFKVVKGY